MTVEQEAEARGETSNDFLSPYQQCMSKEEEKKRVSLISSGHRCGNATFCSLSPCESASLSETKESHLFRGNTNWAQKNEVLLDIPRVLLSSLPTTNRVSQNFLYWPQSDLFAMNYCSWHFASVSVSSLFPSPSLLCCDCLNRRTNAKIVFDFWYRPNK